MFTRCTQCQTVQRISVADLRGGRGLHRCRHCRAQFDALQHLADNATFSGGNGGQNIAAPPWIAPKRLLPAWVWALGNVLLFGLLIAQLVYFEGYRSTQNPRLRPWLTTLCESLRCRLPAYHNPDELTLIGFFSPVQDRYYRFHAAITNEAVFAQRYPAIKLTLLDYQGRAFAARAFKPREYLPDAAKTAELAAKTTTEIDLKIALPKTPVGGSAYELL